MDTDTLISAGIIVLAIVCFVLIGASISHDLKVVEKLQEKEEKDDK